MGGLLLIGGAALAALAALAAAAPPPPRRTAPPEEEKAPKQTKKQDEPKKDAPAAAVGGVVLSLGGAAASVGKVFAGFVAPAAAGAGTAGSSAGAGGLAAAGGAFAVNLGALAIMAVPVLIFLATLIAKAMAAPALWARQRNPVTVRWLHAMEFDFLRDYLAQPGAPPTTQTEELDDRTAETAYVDGANMRSGGARVVVSGGGPEVRKAALRARALALEAGFWRWKWGSQAGAAFSGGRPFTVERGNEDFDYFAAGPFMALPLLDGSASSRAEQEAEQAAIPDEQRRYLKTAALVDVVRAHKFDPQVFIDAREYARRVYCAIFGQEYPRSPPGGGHWHDMGDGVWLLGTTLRLPVDSTVWNVGGRPEGVGLERGVLSLDVVARRQEREPWAQYVE